MLKVEHSDFESGFDLEVRLFPNIKDKKIYAKDYQLMQDLDDALEVSKVGV
jgi:hypothetical protein